nr:uncharacterized protein LOC129270727 [Lytechinus pictus]XP_054764023.1 uncharacterized protein LOC129270727 [Lytechinus pictus]
MEESDGISREQDSTGDNRVSLNKEGNTIKLNFIKEEAETDSWSFSSPKHGNDGLIDPLLEDGNNDAEHSDTDMDGWINERMGGDTERASQSSDTSSQQQPPNQAHHEYERRNRQLLKCSRCASTFSRESSLVEHMKVHDPVYPSHPPLRTRHARVHTPGKRYPQGQRTRGRQGPKTTFPWTDGQEEELVEWWKENECLYNSNSRGYLDKSLRERLYQAKAREIGDGCTAEDVQTHLRSLRTKMNHILKDGQGLGPSIEGWSPRTPRCKWVWDRLDFLIPFIIHRNIKTICKLPKGSSGEDSPSGGSDVSMGVEIIPGTSSAVELGPGPGLRDFFPTRSRGKTKSARPDIASKKAKMHAAAQEQELHAKPRPVEMDHVIKSHLPLTTIHHQPQPAMDVQEAPTTSIPTTTTTTSHHQPVVSTDEEEVKAFLGHLKCTLLRIPADLRMDMQAEILALVYARHKEHRQSCK